MKLKGKKKEKTCYDDVTYGRLQQDGEHQSKQACKDQRGSNLDVGLAAALGSALSAPTLLPDSKSTNMLSKYMSCALHPRGALMIPWRRVDAKG